MSQKLNKEFQGGKAFGLSLTEYVIDPRKKTKI